MAKAVVRIPLDVPPEMADSLDRAVGLLQVETGQRQTRTSFIKLAVQAEISRLETRYAEMMPRTTKGSSEGAGQKAEAAKPGRSRKGAK